MAEKTTSDLLLAELFRFFREHGQDRPLEYTYGFFDAIGIVREVLNVLRI